MHKMMLGAAVASAAVAVPVAGAAKTTSLHTSLTGKAEAPGPGDPDGKGQATIRIKGTRVCYSISWNKIAKPTAGHIHKAPKGSPGPVVVALFGANPKKSACVTAPADVAQAIAKTPSAYYVNFHNGAFPDGAIRGQLRKGSPKKS